MLLKMRFIIIFYGWVLACCNSWRRKESDTTERLNWTEYSLAYIYIHMYVYIRVYNFFIHFFVDEHLDCFHVLATVYSAAMNILMNQFFLQIDAKEWDCWIIWYLVLSFLREVQTVLHSGCTSLHSHQQCNRAPSGTGFLHTLSNICYL